MTPPATANDALRAAIPLLRAAGIIDPARDARLLLAHAMGIAPDRLTLHLADPLPPQAATRFTAFIAARQTHQPLSQITGHRLFWNRPFIVTPDVLDPRPETEILIAEALRRPAQSLLDLGTGTGAILLTLLAEWPGALGLGTDISDAALQIATRNAAALGLGSRASFARSDWFCAISGHFDLILSNPPYITAAEMAALSPDVLDHEPHIALTPGGDGLAAYRQIAAQALRHLTPHGRILVEIGPTQAAAVSALFAEAGLTAIRTLPDLDGRDRVVCAAAP